MKQPANLKSLIAAYVDVLNHKSAAGALQLRTIAPAAHVHTSGKVLTFPKQPLGTEAG